MLIVLSVLILAALYLFYNYYLCHFDVSAENKKDFDILQVKIDKQTGLWPRIRQGEIYALAPDEISNPTAEKFQTLGLLDHITKDEKECILSFRIIKEAENAIIETGKAVKVISDTDFVVSGLAD